MKRTLIDTRRGWMRRRNKLRSWKSILQFEQLEDRRVFANWSGDIPNGTVWSNSEVQRIVGDVRIPAGSTLTILPGTIVKFNEFAGFDLVVDGRLIAMGTASEPILFTSFRDDSGLDGILGNGDDQDTNGNGPSSGNNGDWNAIQVSASSAGSMLDHVRIRNGGAGSFAALVASAAMTLSNSVVENSGSSGVRVQASNPTLSSNTFRNNSVAAISMDLASNPAINGVALTNNVVNALILDSGTLVGNGFWNDPDIVYRLTGDVTVPTGTTLTIGAGQIVKFRTFAGDDLIVDGTLNADGTPSQPIVFTSERDNTAGGATRNNANDVAGNGDWNAIQLRATSSGHVLDNIQIRYGGAGSSAALVSAATMTLSNSVVENSGSSGVRVQASDPTFTANTFRNNSLAAISMDLASNPAITGVVLTNNVVNALILDSGTLVGNGFWNDPDIVYRLSGDVTVPTGKTLTIGAGQVVKFRTFAGDDLIVDGTLNADGTPSQPIVFTSERDNTAGGATRNNANDVAGNGDWNAIQLSPISAGHVLDHVQVRYGGAGSSAALISSAQMTLSNSVIENSNSSGVRIQTSNPTLSSNTYRNNSLAAISMDLASNPAITGVTLANNVVNALILDSGTLAGNGFWNDPDIVYRLSGDLTVPTGTTLTIGAGQIVKFRTFAGDDLIVDGTLNADGTPSQPIVFTSERDNTFGGATRNNANDVANNGDWNAIQLSATSTGHVLDNVVIRYGGAGSSAALVASSAMTLSNSIIENSNSSGARIQASNPTLSTNIFQNNSIAAISMDLASNPTITGVTLSNNVVNALILDSGTLAGNGFWNDPDIVYRLSGDLTVPTGTTLTIGAGQIVKFRTFAGDDLIVDGTLNADGTPSRPIVFTSERDNTFGGATRNNANDVAGNGDWNAIQLRATSTGHVLDNVVIRYGGAGSSAVLVASSAMTLSNSVVENSGSAGVRIQTSNPTLSSNIFRNNSLAAISMDLASNPAINGVTLTNNVVNALILDSGTLVGNGFWNDPDIVYRLTGDVTVPAGTTLTIGTGQIVKFRTFAGDDLIVDGTLIADGTSALPIVFTSDRDDSIGGDTNNNGTTVGNNGDWSSVQLNIGSVANLLNYVEMRFGGGGRNATLIADGASLTLSNSVVRNSSSNAIVARKSSDVNLSSNSIAQNSDTGIRAELDGRVTASSNTIEKNFRGILVNSANAVLTDNRVIGNSTEGVRIETGSTVTIASNTIESNSTGVAANNVIMSVVNNTVVYNQIGIHAQDNSRIVAANNIVAFQKRSGVAAQATGVVQLFNNDIFNRLASVGDYEGVPDPKGAHGNISVDPRFNGRGQTGDYRLFQGSPAIDAGISSDSSLGIVVPSTDALGNARFDDPGIVNTGTGTPAFIDMGAFERQSISEPDADLQLSLSFAPITVLAGDRVSVRWTVTNNGPNVAVGPWVDMVFLQANSASASSPEAVAQIDHPGNLAVGSSYTVEAVFPVRALRIGNYRWVVIADANAQVFEALLEQNNMATSAPVAFDVPALNLSAPSSGEFVSDNDLHWYKLVAPSGQNLRLKLDSAAASGHSELFVAPKYVPNPTLYDVASAPFAGPDTQVDINGTTGDIYYILVRSRGFGANPVAFQLSAESLDFALSRVNRSSGGNAGQVTMTIYGQGIPANATARLVTETGTEIESIANKWIDATTLVTTFDLTGRTTGLTNVAVVSDNLRRTLTGAFRIEQGGDFDFFLEVVGPGLVRVDRQVEFTIVWGNRGNVDAPAHLVNLRSTGPVRVDRTPLGNGMLGQLFLAMSPNATTPIIPAGDRHSIKVFVTGTDIGNFTLDAKFIPVNSPLLLNEPIDFDSIKKEAKPADLSDTQWNTFFAQLVSQLGIDWGTFAQRMAANSLDILEKTPSMFEESAGIWLRPALLSEIAKAVSTLGAKSAPPSPSGDNFPVLSKSMTEGRVRALIVAVSEYTNDDDLPGAAYDLKHAFEFLTRQSEIPFSNDPSKSQVTVLSDRNLDKKLTQKPGRVILVNEMRDAVRQLAASAQEGDTLVVHYSGHGVQVNGIDPRDRTTDGTNGAFQLNSTDPTFGTELYNFRQFLHDLGDSTRASRIVVIADNCYSGGLVQALQSNNIGMTPELISKFTVVTGASATEPSVDADGGGAFSTAYYAALQNPANDTDMDGFVSIQEALQAVGPRVGVGNPLQRLGDYVAGRNPRGSTPNRVGDIDLIVRDARGGSKDKMEVQLESQGRTVLESIGQDLGEARTRGGSRIFRGQAATSRDPNDKASSAFGSAGFILPENTISYVIHFENVADPTVPASLTLPAQEVIVTDTLPSNLDLTSIELTAIGFGNSIIDIPGGRSFFQGTAFVSADPNPVSVQASLDNDNGVITWTLRSYDIETGKFPDDPTAGFLPVNDSTRKGEGFVSFRARPKAGLAEGTSFTNTASIVFDTNAPILTNTTTNTIDGKAPTSNVSALPILSSSSVVVSWTGNDEGGSGIASYDLFVSDNDGAFVAFRTNLTTTTTTFSGVVGHKYSFFTIATDNVGNREAQPSIADAITTISTTIPWTNPLNAMDTDDSGDVSPLDVLVLINEININGSRKLPEGQNPLEPRKYLDVDNDGFVGPLDVLVIINFLNQRASGAGEAPPIAALDEFFEKQDIAPTQIDFAMSQLSWFDTIDEASEFKRRRSTIGR